MTITVAAATTCNKRPAAEAAHRHKSPDIPCEASGSMVRSAPHQKLSTWIILAMVLAMAISTLNSSVQLQTFWESEIFLPQLPEKLVHTEEQRKERYRVYRHYPPEPRTTPVPDEICGSPPDFELFFNKQLPNRRSAFDEDKTLNTLFGNIFQENAAPGTFVEIGAYNGRSESNTRFFSLCLGWQGLLIEANPKIYKALVRNRPHDHRMSFSPTCTMAQELNRTTVTFHNVDFSTTGIQGLALTQAGTPTVQVPCGNLNPLLHDLFPNGHVDLFSMDLEGAEAMVVEQLDFSNLFIELFVIENNSTLCEQECDMRRRVRKRLTQADYKLYPNVVDQSDLFIHPKSKYQIPAQYKTIPVADYVMDGV